MEQSEALAARLGMPVPTILQAKEVIATATDEGLEELAGAVAPLTRNGHPCPGLAPGLPLRLDRPDRRPLGPARRGPPMPRPVGPLAGAGPGLDPGPPPDRLPCCRGPVGSGAAGPSRSRRARPAREGRRSRLPQPHGRWPPGLGPPVRPDRPPRRGALLVHQGPGGADRAGRPSAPRHHRLRRGAHVRPPGRTRRRRDCPAPPRTGPGPVRDHRHERLDPPGRRTGGPSQAEP